MVVEVGFTYRGDTEESSQCVSIAGIISGRVCSGKRGI